MIGEMVGEMFDGFWKIIVFLFICIIIGSATFGFCGYKIGKSSGYEQGAKDALNGKLKWAQTIKLDSVIIKK